MKYAALILFLCLALAGPAAAQLRPTMPMSPAYSGPSVMGIDTGTLRDPAGINYGNLYMTGQVTNGASFHGAVPYFAPGQIELALPTAQFDNFRRDSFGMERYQGGVNYYVPQPFYRPSTTLYTSGDALAGRLTPLRGMVPLSQTNTVPGATNLTPYQMIPPLDQISPLPPGTFSPVLPMAQMPGMEPNSTQMPASAVDMTEESDVRPEFSTLFGLVDSAQNARLNKQLARKERDTPSEADKADALAAAGETPELPGVPKEKHTGQSAAARNGQGGQDKGGRAEQQEGEALGTYGRFAAPAVIKSGKSDTQKLEEDVFANVIKKLAKPTQADRLGADRFGQTDLGAETSQSARGMALPAVQPDRTDLESLDVAPTRRRPTAQQDSILVLPADRYVVLDHLGGSEDDVFNDQMRQGDKDLRAGQFYQAATRFESAAMLRRTNPLPPAGAGLAYLGAGESYRASRMLRRAMRMYPAMIRVRLDVDQFLGKEIADQRLSELELRLKGSPLQDHVPLVFLVTFMHASRNDLAERNEWAAKLAGITKDDPLLTAYARQFLPDETAQPASAPAAIKPAERK